MYGVKPVAWPLLQSTGAIHNGVNITKQRGPVVRGHLAKIDPGPMDERKTTLSLADVPSYSFNHVTFGHETAQNIATN